MPSLRALSASRSARSPPPQRAQPDGCLSDAGTVLLTEEALLEVPEEAPEGHTLHTALAQQLLRRKGVDEAESRVFGYLHPQRLSDMPEGDLAACREKWGDVAGKLAAEAGCGEDEALQAVLKMQFNALRSGVYTRIAMVNHACLPSCAAFG